MRRLAHAAVLSLFKSSPVSLGWRQGCFSRVRFTGSLQDDNRCGAPICYDKGRKDAVALGLLTAEGKLVEHIGAEGFLVHLGDHDWVLSGFAASRCVAYLRDYAKRSFGTLPEARFNALRNYIGSRVSYMRLYQAIAQGGADALVALVVKA